MTSRFAAPALSLLLLTAASSGCVDDVGEGKVAAEVSEPTPAAETSTPAPAAAPATTVAIDRAKSSIDAVGAKVTKKHDITFDDWSGELQVRDGTLAGIDVTINMEGLRADATKLTAHLKNEDFFDVPSHPTATFKSTSVEAKAGENGATHVVTGDLTMRGTTKSVAFPATVRTVDGKLEASAEFVVNRHDFGVSYAGRKDDLIQDNVVLKIVVVGS